MPTKNEPVRRGRPMGVQETKPRVYKRKDDIATRKRYADAAKIAADRRRGQKRAYWRVRSAEPVPLHDEVERILKQLRCIRCGNENITLSEINEEQVLGSARCRGCAARYNWTWDDIVRIETFKASSSTHKRGGVRVEVDVKDLR